MFKFYINISIHISFFSVSFLKIILFQNKNIYLGEAKKALSSVSKKIIFLITLKFF